MRRTRWIVLLGGVFALVAVAACGSFSGSDGQGAGDGDSGGNADAATDRSTNNGRDAGGPSDAPTTEPLDGAAFSCSQAPTAFFCADFDETPPLAYNTGTPLGLSGLPDGSAITAPGVSAPSAFWSAVNTFRVKTTDNKAVTYVHAAFQIRFDSTRIGTGGFARLGVQAGSKQCSLNLKQEQGPDRIGIDTHCSWDGPDFYDHKDLLTPLPAAGVWLPAELTLDVANSTAFGKIGNSTATMVLNAAAKAGGAPTVEFGPDFTANRVGIDNVLVDVK